MKVVLNVFLLVHLSHQKQSIRQTLKMPLLWLGPKTNRIRNHGFSITE